MPQNELIKKRNWAFVAYPESLPEDWLEILQLSGLKIAISPLHDKDLNPDGKVKKAHYHIILCYGNPTTYNNVLNLTKRLNASKPISLEQVRGYYRYFTHKDNPEKAQYDENEIKCLNGFDHGDFVELTGTEKDKIKERIFDIIAEYDLVEYFQLIDLLKDMAKSGALSFEYFRVAINNTMLFDAYLRSRRWYGENYRNRTGETELEYRPTKERERETEKTSHSEN